MTLKAYNGRCVLAWLSEKVYEASLNPAFAAVDERFDLIAAATTLGLQLNHRKAGGAEQCLY